MGMVETVNCWFPFTGRSLSISNEGDPYSRYGKLLLWEGVFVKVQEGVDWGTFRYTIPEVFLSKLIQELCAFSCTKREHMFHFSLLCHIDSRLPVDVGFETWVCLWSEH